MGARERLTTPLNRFPTVGELAGELDVSEEQLLDAPTAQQARSGESLDVLADTKDSPGELPAVEGGYTGGGPVLAGPRSGSPRGGSGRVPGPAGWERGWAWWSCRSVRVAAPRAGLGCSRTTAR